MATASKSTASKKSTGTAAAKNGKATADKKAPVSRKKDGLRKPQLRILHELATCKTGTGMTRKELLEANVVDPAWLYVQLGQPDAARNNHNEEKWGVKSLVTWGYASFKIVTVEKGVTEEIAVATAAGRKAYQTALKTGEIVVKNGKIQ